MYITFLKAAADAVMSETEEILEDTEKSAEAVVSDATEQVLETPSEPGEFQKTQMLEQTLRLNLTDVSFTVLS